MASSGGGGSVKSSNGNGRTNPSTGRSLSQSSGSPENFNNPNANASLSYHATTIIKTIKCHYLWTISNYTFVKDKDESIKSPKFTTPDGTEWYLRVHPLGFNRDVPERNFVSAYLCVYQPNQGHVQAKHRGKILSFEDDIHDALKTMERSAKMGKVDCFTRDNFSWGWPEFISHGDLFDDEKKFLQNDSIRILWYLEILVEVENAVNRIEIPRATLGVDFGELLKSGRGSDVVIRSKDNKEHRAHKLIISQRSKYFEAMFNHPTKENNKATVDLPDDSNIIQLLLEFMYTDKVIGTGDVPAVQDLLVAADKYQIDNLKRSCEFQLIERMASDNACQLFLLAANYNAEDLKRESKQFIAANLRSVIKTPGWNELKDSEEGFGLATDLLDMQTGREAEAGSGQESMA
ncbi:speckle-type POZ protein B-like [Paramacrobiotus metropolitanus]|uniref:speckle-type POZ protein B-like n=1 Tax=Paramacrobiotus metropolitanus TaxID=2943436 RepID=UPI00244597F0|nr:speckle-type POZ protein B-like [Paramacrobiotus metropolitanus]